MEKELLTCPWCGEQMRFDADSVHVWYKCDNCWANSPKARRLWDDGKSNKENWDINKAKALFLIQRSEAKTHRWFSVNEMLPADRARVLMRIPGCDLREGLYLTVTGFEYYDKAMKPWTWRNVDSLVTHWMPLPEPPKEFP